ncbi:hypothetical protein K449DRAFT_439569 [Hypoxylon sp. EC38]|nr:hypothetical protein K449DRAFT_439569 [Hypoxylon sp. EC38]
MESADSEIHKKNAALRGFESLLAGIVALFLYYNIPVIYQACITTIYEKLGLDTWALKMAFLTVNFLFNTPRSVSTLDKWSATHWRKLAYCYAVLLQASTLYGLNWITAYFFNIDFSSIILHFVIVDTVLFTIMLSLGSFIPFYSSYAYPILFFTLKEYE